MSIPERYPDPPAAALAQLVADFEAMAPKPHAVAVYGSLARDNYRPGDSDVNLAIALQSPTAKVLSELRKPLNKASEAARIQPFIVGVDELPRLADVFPIMIYEIKHHHDLILGGADPFNDVVIDRADLRLQVEHELRNHLLRLRRYYLFTGDDSSQLGRGVMSSVASLAYELGALLHVVDQRPEERNRAAIFSAAGEAFGLDSEALTRILTYRPSADDSAEQLEDLFFALLGAVEGAVEAVDKLDNKVRGATHSDV